MQKIDIYCRTIVWIRKDLYIASFRVFDILYENIFAIANGIFSKNSVPRFQRKRTAPLDGFGQESGQELRSSYRAEEGGKCTLQKFIWRTIYANWSTTYFFANSVDSVDINETIRLFESRSRGKIYAGKHRVYNYFSIYFSRMRNDFTCIIRTLFE